MISLPCPLSRIDLMSDVYTTTCAASARPGHVILRHHDRQLQQFDRTVEASPGAQREKTQISEDAKRLGGEVEAFRQEREELRAAKAALSEEILELRRANLVLLETVKGGSAITTRLTEDLRCVWREEEEKERTEMLSQENVALRREALDHKRDAREEDNKLQEANNEIRALKGRSDEMEREAAREREALDKAWQRKLGEAEMLARIAIKEERHSGTTGVAEELAAIAFGGHVKTWVRGESLDRSSSNLGETPLSTSSGSPHSSAPRYCRTTLSRPSPVRHHDPLYFGRNLHLQYWRYYRRSVVTIRSLHGTSTPSSSSDSVCSRICDICSVPCFQWCASGNDWTHPGPIPCRGFVPQRPRHPWQVWTIQ
jgi:hypothetical protein